MPLYYISPFNFFYTKNEKLGEEFMQALCGLSWTDESESEPLTYWLSKIGKIYEHFHIEFDANFISIQELITGILKRDLNNG